MDNIKKLENIVTVASLSQLAQSIMIEGDGAGFTIPSELASNQNALSDMITRTVVSKLALAKRTVGE